MRKFVGNLASWGVPGPTTLFPLVAGAVTLFTSLLGGLSFPLAILACLAAAALGLLIAVLSVWLWDRLGFRKPQLRISAGKGFEFVHSTRPLKNHTGERAFDELIEWDFPQDQFTSFHTLKLKVAETAHVRATNVVVRITGINPPPETGQYSLPIRLANVTGLSDVNTLEPGDVGYVALLHVAQTVEGRTGVGPGFWFLHDEWVFEVEALVDGKRSDALRYYRMSGLVARTPEGKRVVCGIPELEEVESLNPNG